MSEEGSGIHSERKGQSPVQVIFVHHSTGRILLREGGVRKLIAERNSRSATSLELWDHDYNEIGLSGPDGELGGISYDLPGNNTNPDGFEILFSQPVHDPPDNAFGHLLDYDVIVFKPCFPVCAIKSDRQLEEYKAQYRTVRSVVNRHPDKLFIAMTPPPLASIPLVGPVLGSSEQWTNRADARRARAFSEWLVEGDFAEGAENLEVFDLFDMLASPASATFAPNTLRMEYRSGKRGPLGLDSHPNARAARAFAPVFVDFLFEAVARYKQRADVAALR